MLPALILCVMIGGVFGRSITNGFVYDDHELIETSQLTNELNPITHLTAPFWAHGENATEYYRPLTSWSWALERAVLGAQPWGHHLGNLLLHALSSCLLFLLLGQIAPRWTAWLAAAFFALHPVQAEAVNWISGRPDLLATALLLTALLIYSKLPDIPVRGALLPLGLFTLLPALALLAKESAVTFPALCFAIDLARAFERDTNMKAAFLAALRRLRWLGPFYIAPIAGYLVLRTLVVGQLIGGAGLESAESLHPLASASLGVRLMTAVEVAAQYLRLIVFPMQLTVDYKYDVIPLVVSPFTRHFAMSAVALIVVGGIAFGLARRRPAALFGLIAAVGTYSLLSHLFFTAPVIMAERVMYLPMAGISVLLAVGLLTVSQRLLGGSSRAPQVLALLVVCLLGARSVTRAADWRSDLTLFEAAAQVAPRSVLAWNNLGHAQQAQGDRQAALASTERALHIHPQYLRSRQQHALLQRELGKLERAEIEFRLILEEHPDSGDSWLNLVQLLSLRAEQLQAQGLLEDARLLLEECVSIARQQAVVAQTYEKTGGAAAFMMTAAAALQSLGDAEQAEQLFLSAIAMSDGELQSGILSRFAILLIQNGRPAEAAQRFEQAARAAGSPTTAARLELNASRAHSLAGNTDAAQSALDRAESLDVEDSALQAEILRVMAEAAVTRGSPSQALPLYDRLLEIDPASSRARLGRARTLLALDMLERARTDLDILAAEHPDGKIGNAIRTDLARLKDLAAAREYEPGDDDDD
jgi:tetratricopeptide (TPR) repeat protein